MKERGIVKWFSAPKGYGFIKRSTGEDVFVHYTSIEMEGYRKLREGDEVEYELKHGPRGLLAAGVVPVGGRTSEKLKRIREQPGPKAPGEPAEEHGAAGDAQDDPSDAAANEGGGDVSPENAADEEEGGTPPGSPKHQAAGY